MTDTATTTPNEPQIGTPEYDAMMVAKAQEANGTTVPTRPEHIPEKFWDAEKGEVRVEDLAKSYAELEKGKSKPKDEPPKMGDKPDGEKPNDEGNKPDGEFDLAKHREGMSAKMLAGEAFTDEDYAPFEKMGFKREDIDAIAQALAGQATVDATEVYNLAGGEDKYATMVEWGKANYSPEEIEAYDAALRGTPAQRKAAIKGLEARFQIANGADGVRDVTERGAKITAERFESKAEMVNAMRDPRYSTDSAYRAEVERKVMNARLAGVNLQI